MDCVASYPDSGSSLFFPIPSVKVIPNGKFNPNSLINFGD
jgi:hypothetical protein